MERFSIFLEKDTVASIKFFLARVLYKGPIWILTALLLQTGSLNLGYPSATFHRDDES